MPIDQYARHRRMTLGDFIEENEIDVYYDGFIMTYILTDYATSFPWLDAALAIELDVEFTKGHSCDKLLSPLFARLNAEVDHGSLDPLTVSEKMIVAKYAEKWKRIHDALFADYNPISNYDMTEDENTGTNVKTHTYEGDGAGNETENKVFGFNSETAVPTGTSSMKSALQTEGDFEDNHRQLTRSGNIGTTTTQMMIESELELRKHQFTDIILDDLASFFCLRAY